MSASPHSAPARGTVPGGVGAACGAPGTLDAAPLVDADALRAAGRTPPATFRVRLAADDTLLVRRLLRVLPGKRLVAEGEHDGARVLAKLFVGPASARHWHQEHEGLHALAAAGVPTPRLVAARSLPGGGHMLLTEFLDGADTVLDAWRPLAACAAGDDEALALLVPVFALLGRLHAAGLSHDDLHFGNFLRHRGALYLIDGDAVSAHGARPLAEKAAARDLAMLLAQLPRTWDDAVAPLLEAYRSANPDLPSHNALERALRAERAWRLRDYLSKVGRDCSLFKVERRFDRFVAVVRSESQALAPLLADPDRYLASGLILKRGNTCTLARVTLGDRTVVVKRYNIKSARHALSRLWRPSRAWHAWREGHLLRLFGIPTPAPLAIIEERRGPLRARAWLVTEYCAGTDLLHHLDPSAPPPAAVAAALRSLFATLHRTRMGHGDLKATNLLWDGRNVHLIDLDAMRQYRSATAHSRAWRRDRTRLLRNWPQASELYRWLDCNLPPSS